MPHRGPNGHKATTPNRNVARSKFYIHCPASAHPFETVEEWSPAKEDRNLCRPHPENKRRHRYSDGRRKSPFQDSWTFLAIVYDCSVPTRREIFPLSICPCLRHLGIGGAIAEPAIDRQTHSTRRTDNT